MLVYKGSSKYRHIGIFSKVVVELVTQSLSMA